MNITIVSFVLLLLFPLLTSCEQDDEDWVAEKAVNKVENIHAKKQIEKYGFNYNGAGGGGNGEKFTLLKLAFSTRKALTVDSARKYLVEGVLSYQSDINNDDELQQYLFERPYPIERIGYEINVVVGNGLWPIFPTGYSPENKISYAYVKKGKIYYLIDVHKDKLPVVIHEETFEEAQAIVEAEKK